MGLIAIEGAALPKRLTYFELLRWDPSRASRCAADTHPPGARIFASCGLFLARPAVI
jgi:hypothetical protein